MAAGSPNHAEIPRSALLAVCFVSAAAVALALAGELKLTIANGRVTLIAQDVPVREILAEWARRRPDAHRER